MTKFHINPVTGKASPCSATKGVCPFGGRDEHWPSKKEAMAHYEEYMAGHTLPEPSSKELEHELAIQSIERESFTPLSNPLKRADRILADASLVEDRKKSEKLTPENLQIKKNKTKVEALAFSLSSMGQYFSQPEVTETFNTVGRELSTLVASLSWNSKTSASNSINRLQDFQESLQARAYGAEESGAIATAQAYWMASDSLGEAFEGAALFL